MDTYMYHMLLQARAGHELELQTGVATCPFCLADQKQALENTITSGLTGKRADGVCRNCPLQNLFNLDTLLFLMEDCLGMGKHALDMYEKAGEL
jgi:hypothetical protein